MLVDPRNCYKHYKGGLYFIIYERVLHTEIEEDLVIYTDGSRIYARPYDMFHGYAPEGVKRFEKISYSSTN